MKNASKEEQKEKLREKKKAWKDSLKKRKTKFNFDDPSSVLEDIRDRRKPKMKTRIRCSKLDKYRLELRLLRERGATLVELHEFLVSEKVECSVSTVQRWLKKGEQEK
ncbi:hypothetical protein BCT06_16960 [Vibrio breoganii]|uniref:hypothetical protein n=1 Tax=Vibrio breoganii TaxID=553239 RepID=UPI000C82B42F|nr:hypothetical protein [Vibrio breoganii]PMO57298.1 hypothetical protein BCT06_16960 [Vibrio breoganii]